MQNRSTKSRKAYLPVLAVLLGATGSVVVYSLFTLQETEEECLRSEAQIPSASVVRTRVRWRRAESVSNSAKWPAGRDLASLETMLASVRGTESEDDLVALAWSDDDVRVRITALRRLAESHGPQVRATFLRLAHDRAQPDRVRAEAARYLGRTGDDALQAIEQIVDSDAPAAVRCGAVLGLGELGTPGALSRALDLAGGGPGDLRISALRAVESGGRAQTIAALSNAARDVRHPADTRAAACRALAATRDSAAAPALRELAAAGTTPPRVRAAAVEGLGTMGDSGGGAAVAAACGDRHPEVAREARTARTRLAHVR